MSTITKQLQEEIQRLQDEKAKIEEKEELFRNLLIEEAKREETKMSDEEDILDISFIDFLAMKMAKRNGSLKDDGKDEEKEEDTDFVFDLAQPKAKKSSSSSSSSSSLSPLEGFENEFVAISKLKNQKKFVIKGLVQSGKTEYMICLMLYMLMTGKSVVMVVRNIEDDRVQFCKRFEEFKKRYDHFKEIRDIYLVDNVLKFSSKKYDENPKIYLLLDNQSNIKKINEILIKTKVRYVTIFDEADYVDSGKGIKAKYYDILKVRSSKIFWVSATIMDMLLKEEGISGDNIIFLNPSDKKNYKGVINNRIKMMTIPESKYVGGVDEDVFECNPHFSSFLEEYKTKEVFETHPRICLVNLSHCIEPLEKAQLKIAVDHPELSVIVYNSPGLVFQKGPIRIRGEDVKCCNVSSFLQYLKQNGGVEEHSHIIIMSGYMAGRGISFVSEDYGWHLTDEYLVLSKTSDEPELIQKVRLQGIYRDDIPLTLYTTDDVQKDLLKTSYRIEELSQACKDNTDESKKLLTSIPINREKFTKRDMAKNITAKMNKVKQSIGWSLEIYNGEELMPDEFLESHGLEISEEDREKFKEDKDKKEEIEENKNSIIDGVSIQKLLKWIKSNTIVGKCLKYLYRHYNESIDSDILRDAIDYSGSEKQFTNTMANGLGIRCRYGKLWSFKDGKYQINKNIKNYIDHHNSL